MKKTTLEPLDPQIFDDFVRNHPQKSHFLQSANWGRFAAAKKHFTPYYLGLKDSRGHLLAATLLLQKKLPLGLCYFYAPRGFVIDFSDQKLLQTMTEAVVDFCREHHAIFFKIDPDLIKSGTNYLGEPVELPYKSSKIFDNLLSLGYRHQGYTKNFETNQPRYTFRIDLTPDWDTIEHHFHKTAKRCIKKAKQLGVKVEIGTADDVATFAALMAITESRKGIVNYAEDYYQQFYADFAPDRAKLFLGKVSTPEIIDYYQTEKRELEAAIARTASNKKAASKLRDLEKRLAGVEQNLQRYREARQNYGDEIVLSAHMIVFYGDKAWYLYGGNHNILAESCANYLTFVEHIKYAKEQGITTYDEFGTIGDFNPENPRLGLHEFKKKFGGDYLEFFGEFDYVLRPFPYFIFQKLIPTYRKLVKKHLSHQISSQTSEND